MQARNDINSRRARSFEVPHSCLFCARGTNRQTERNAIMRDEKGEVMPPEVGNREPWQTGRLRSSLYKVSLQCEENGARGTWEIGFSTTTSIPTSHGSFIPSTTSNTRMKARGFADRFRRRDWLRRDRGMGVAENPTGIAIYSIQPCRKRTGNRAEVIQISEQARPGRMRSSPAFFMGIIYLNPFAIKVSAHQ